MWFQLLMAVYIIFLLLLFSEKGTFWIFTPTILFFYKVKRAKTEICSIDIFIIESHILNKILYRLFGKTFGVLKHIIQCTYRNILLVIWLFSMFIVVEHNDMLYVALMHSQHTSTPFICQYKLLWGV